MSQMWIRCPSCDLVHSARADRTCPRCGRTIPSSAYEASISTDTPPDEQAPRRSRLPLPASPSPDRAPPPVASSTATPAPTPLTRYGTSASSLRRQLSVRADGPSSADEPAPASSWLVSLFAGVLASAVGGAAWGYAVIGIGRHAGFGAALVGLATGLAVRGFGGRGLGPQIIAALCVILGFGVGKALIIESPVALTALIEKTSLDDRAMIIPALVRLADEGTIPRAVGQRILALPLDADDATFAEAMADVSRYELEAVRRVQSSDPAQRQGLVSDYLATVMNGQPFITRARVATAINDAVLWLFLAMLIAFRLVPNKR